MAGGGGVAQRSVLRVNKPEKTGARSAVGRSAAKTYKYNVLVKCIPLILFFKNKIWE
jgi:hypothetical protein